MSPILALTRPRPASFSMDADCTLGLAAQLGREFCSPNWIENCMAVEGKRMYSDEGEQKNESLIQPTCCISYNQIILIEPLPLPILTQIFSIQSKHTTCQICINKMLCPYILLTFRLQSVSTPKKCFYPKVITVILLFVCC